MQVCLSCGDLNPPDATSCQSCGAPLSAPAAPPPAPVTDEPAPSEAPSQTLGTPTSHPDDITTRYDEFARMVEKLRTGGVSPQDFVDWLEQARAQMETRRNLFINALEAMGEDEEDQTQIREAMEGILDFEEAIEEMWAFTMGQTGVSGLDSALARMWQANLRINDAMRKNRHHRASLEDDWGFM